MAATRVFLQHSFSRFLKPSFPCSFFVTFTIFMSPSQSLRSLSTAGIAPFTYKRVF
ncbi:hypothetical protein ACS0TY_034022 [Phlomoides rotata]